MMSDFDYALISGCRVSSGRIRQQEILGRRTANLPALTGADAVQQVTPMTSTVAAIVSTTGPSQSATWGIHRVATAVSPDRWSGDTFRTA
jgi:hypothetical protein